MIILLVRKEMHKELPSGRAHWLSSAVAAPSLWQELSPRRWRLSRCLSGIVRSFWQYAKRPEMQIRIANNAARHADKWMPSGRHASRQIAAI